MRRRYYGGGIRKFRAAHETYTHTYTHTPLVVPPPISIDTRGGAVYIGGKEDDGHEVAAEGIFLLLPAAGSGAPMGGGRRR